MAIALVGDQCRCLREVPKEAARATDISCDTPCSAGEGELCGGSTAASVYRLPSAAAAAGGACAFGFAPATPFDDVGAGLCMTGGGGTPPSTTINAIVAKSAPRSEADAACAARCAAAAECQGYSVSDANNCRLWALRPGDTRSLDLTAASSFAVSGPVKDSRFTPWKGARCVVKSQTPLLHTASASVLRAGENLTLAGEGFSGAAAPTVSVCGGVACAVVAANLTHITCTMPACPAADAAPVVVHVPPHGYAAPCGGRPHRRRRALRLVG